jgi:hypothetical protein
MTSLPTWLVCEGCERKGRAYQFPPDRNHPERRNRATLCYECWYGTLPTRVGDRVKIGECPNWSTQEIAAYANRDGKIVGYSPSGGSRGWEVEVFGGHRDGARIWLTLEEFTPIGGGAAS